MELNKQKGITLIALVITITVLLILAGISLNALSGENGILKKSVETKEAKAISEEKDIVKISVSQTLDEDVSSQIDNDILQSKLDNNAGEGKTRVILDDTKIIVNFIEEGRYYEVDDDGNLIILKEVINDQNAGDITKDGECDGSEAKPFKINCIEDLVTFSIMTSGGNTELGIDNNSFENCKVILMRTLNFKSMFSYNDCKTTKYGDLNKDGVIEDIRTELTKKSENCIGFSPITNFKGNFDGQENEIQNIYINRDAASALFVITSKCESITNLGVTGEIISNKGNAAGIVTRLDGGGGTPAGIIDNCWNKAKINGGDYRVAGICGAGSNNIVKNCYNTGDVTSTKDSGCVGGIVASQGADVIENCYNTGNINGGTDTWYVGGIASGHGNNRTIVRNCYNTGNISRGSSAGGILAVNGNVIENCYNTGDIIINNGNQYAGGIVGRDSTEIKNCYNTGNISGNRVGGISSKLGNKIINCYNEGELKGNQVGGIAGLNETDNAIISNCFSVSNITFENYMGSAGGILGANSKNVKINNSYAISKIFEYDTWGKLNGGILGRNEGTATITKCYYLKAEGTTVAIGETEDSTLDVIQCSEKSEITADILNENISIIEHDDEWKIWEQGNEYPIFKK